MLFERWSDTMWNIDKWEVFELELQTCLDNKYRWKEKDTSLEFWALPMSQGKGKCDDRGE